MVKSMHRTGLLQQFQHVTVGNGDDEPIGPTTIIMGRFLMYEFDL